MITSQKVLTQLDAVLDRYQAVSDAQYIRLGRVKELLVSAQAIIQRFAPQGSPYLLSCREALETEHVNDDGRLDWLMGVVASLRHDYAAGALTPIQALIRAEVFDDFLDMAEHLLSQATRTLLLCLSEVSSKNIFESFAPPQGSQRRSVTSRRRPIR